MASMSSNTSSNMSSNVTNDINNKTKFESMRNPQTWGQYLMSFGKKKITYVEFLNLFISKKPKSKQFLFEIIEFLLENILILDDTFKKFISDIPIENNFFLNLKKLKLDKEDIIPDEIHIALKALQLFTINEPINKETFYQLYLKYLEKYINYLASKIDKENQNNKEKIKLSASNIGKFITFIKEKQLKQIVKKSLEGGTINIKNNSSKTKKLSIKNKKTKHKKRKNTKT